MSGPRQPPGNEDPTRAEEGPYEGPGAPPPLERLGDFELLREIGRGGMGLVYEARQISLKRRVALKVLPPALGMPSQARQRFEREAQAAAKLHHTNIVPVHAIGEHAGHHFYAMDLIDGQSLDRVLREVAERGSNPLLAETVSRAAPALPKEREAPADSPPATTSQGGGVSSSLGDTSAGSRPWFEAVARLIAEVADGLDYAHGRGIIHRDIKPANLMLSKEGRLCITDFGLARIVQEPGMTVTGAFLGTPAYMSPEQIAAGRMNLDHRTDVYSLGAVLYEMLTLQRPFPGESRDEVLGAIMTKDPRPPRRLNSRVPQDLETICLKALEKDPDRRYATAGAFAHDLRQYLQHGLIAARRVGLPRRALKWVRRHPVAATAMLSGLLIAAIGITAWRAVRVQQKGRAVVEALAAAERALDAGLYREGLEHVDRGLALDPGDASARLLRARLLFQLGRSGEAVEEAQALLQETPEDWTAHLVMAAAGLGARGASGLPQIPVERHIDAVEQYAPDSAEAYRLRASLAQRAQDQLRLLDRALELDPSNAEALRQRIDVHYRRLKDFDAALQDCERLIIARPRSAQGRRIKAQVLAARPDHGQALQELERAMQVDPLDPLNLEARARLYRARGQWTKAVEDFTRAIELDPSDALFHDGRARAHNSAGDFESAIADARRALELEPDHRWAYEPLLEAYWKQGREAELVACLDELRSRAEGWAQRDARAWAYREIAERYRVMGDERGALEAAGLAVEADRGDFRNFFLRAAVRRTFGHDEGFNDDCDAAAAVEVSDPQEALDRARRLGDDCRRFEAAVPEITRVIERVPYWFEVHRWRSRTYHALMRFEEALVDIERAIELAPRNPDLYNDRANTYAGLGRFEDAVRDRARLLEIDPYNVQGWSNYGLALYYLGRTDESMEALDNALELDPRHNFATAVRGWVRAAAGRCEEALRDLHRAVELDPLNWATRANVTFAITIELFYRCPEHADLEAALEHGEFTYRAGVTGADALAMALFRHGEYAAAKERFTGGTYHGMNFGFASAMCSWHLGDADGARKLFTETAAWQEKYRPHHAGSLLQRQEAARLLGMDTGS